MLEACREVEKCHFTDTPLSSLPAGAGDHPGDKTAGHSQAEPHILHKDSSTVKDPCHKSEGPTVRTHAGLLSVRGVHLQ